MSVKYWQDQIKLYEKEFEQFLKRGKKVYDRYLDERNIQENGSSNDGQSRFNILWANTETIFPAVFAKLPKPDVSRRFKDKDPAGRVASLILERCLEYEIEQYSDFESALRNSVYDRLLPGRGVAWVRYEPTFIQGEPITGQITEDVGEGYEPEYEQVLAKECAPVDYVNWMDFGHSCAKTYEEVRGVWRIVLMDKDALEARFGSIAEERGYSIDDIPLDKAQANLEGIPEARQQDLKKSAVYEVWDKQEKKVYWIVNGMDIALDERDDPLKLEGFFPCPKPIYATTSTHSLVPVADYLQYQDQAQELDEITNRIKLLIKAVRVSGVYDGSQQEVGRLLNERGDNTLIPVDNWAMFGEKGGIKGVVDWFPVDMVVQCLQQCYVAREQIKQVIYEITGIADILRGQSQASETATAQQIKANYAGLRIRNLQTEIARFARDLIRLKAEIICQFFSDETLINMSGAQFMSDEDKQYVGEALQLLRNDVLRTFRIDIESDSMVEADEAAQKEQATELLVGTADFMNKVTTAVQGAPELAPLLMEVFMFALRRYKVGKSIEGQYQQTFDAMLEKLQNPQPTDSGEAQLQAQLQADMEKENMRLQTQAQSDQLRVQADIESSQFAEQNKAQIRAMELQHDAEQKERDRQHQYALRLLELQYQGQIDTAINTQDNETEIITAQISADSTMTEQQETMAEDAVGEDD